MDKELTVMIISDKKEVISLLSEFIHSEGFSTREYLYEAGCEIEIKSPRPNLILLDVFDSEKALEIIEKITQTQRTRKIPVLVGVDKDKDKNLKKYIRAGAKDFITKPYYLEQVGIRVRNHLELVLALKESKGKKLQFDALLNNTPYMAWFKDKDSNYIMVNDEMIEHCGKDFETIKGRDDAFVWDGQIGGKCREYDLVVMEKRKQVVFDEVIPGKKGYRQFNIYKAPVVDENGDVTGTIGIARDITELKNQDAKLKIIMENIPFGVCLKDKDGVLLNVNSKFCEFFDVEREEAIGNKASLIVGKSQIPIMAEEDEKIVKEKRHLIFERTIQESHSGERIMEVHKSPVFDISGEISGIVGLFRDVTDLKKAEEEIRRLAYTDSLTDLANRRGLYKYIEELKQEGQDITIMVIDLDNFKLLNDTCGHYYGDEAIVFIARKLKQLCGQAFTARTGGDEFVIVWKNLNSREMIFEKAEEILAVLPTEFGKGDKLSVISASVGIVSGNFAEDDIESLLVKGDVALYKAKEKGKNQYVYYTKELDEERAFNLKIERDLERAVEREEIELFYQPQYTTDKQLRGFEALFRWNNSNYRNIPVSNIIKRIEESNLIDSIGDCIIEKAFTFAKKANTISIEPVRISVNISAIQIMNANFVEKIKNYIEKVGVSPKHISIEITETVLLENIDKNIEKLKELRELGITISLDDFGTGYSSLNYLVKLPLSDVKIDRSFVMGMSEGDEYKMLVKLIVDTAKSLKLPVVAEGVETEKELEILKNMDVDYVQGYYFSRPVPEMEAEKLIEKRI